MPIYELYMYHKIRGVRVIHKLNVALSHEKQESYSYNNGWMGAW